MIKLINEQREMIECPHMPLEKFINQVFVHHFRVDVPAVSYRIATISKNVLKNRLEKNIKILEKILNALKREEVIDLGHLGSIDRTRASIFISCMMNYLYWSGSLSSMKEYIEAYELLKNRYKELNSDDFIDVYNEMRLVIKSSDKEKALKNLLKAPVFLLNANPSLRAAELAPVNVSSLLLRQKQKRSFCLLPSRLIFRMTSAFSYVFH